VRLVRAQVDISGKPGLNCLDAACGVDMIVPLVPILVRTVTGRAQ